MSCRPLLLSLAVLAACDDPTQPSADTAETTGPRDSVDTAGASSPPLLPTSRPDPWRPQFHFSPLSGWLNDPNGLVHLDGEFHLFFQHFPDAPLWGTMHWGHALSADLVHWQPQPVALYPDDTLGAVFSGSAVVARPDSRVCGASDPSPECLVAVFTHHGGADGTQKQSLAYSLDRGRSWSNYAGNPVLEDPTSPDFRDPKVFWDDAAGRWVMVLAAGPEVRLYGSDDLVAWSHLSSLDPPGMDADVLECPDLFELAIEGEAETRWVLKVDAFEGLQGSSPSAYYLVGSFSQGSFVPDGPARLVDHGMDFYAAQSWSNAPADARIWTAWMSHWSYALITPTETFRGAMALPRRVGLRRTSEGVALTQRPIDALAELRAGVLVDLQELEIDGESAALDGLSGRALEIVATIDVGTADRVGLRVRVGADQATVLSYDVPSQRLTLDRSASGVAPVEHFAGHHDAPLTLDDGRLDLHIFVDWSSIEVFAARGSVVLSDLIFPDAASDGLSLFAEGGVATLARLKVHSLNTIWPQAAP